MKRKILLIIIVLLLAGISNANGEILPPPGRAQNDSANSGRNGIDEQIASTQTLTGAPASNTENSGQKLYRPIKLWPLFYYSKTEDEENWDLLWPLFISRKSLLEHSQSKHILLLYHSSQIENEKSKVFFPFLWLDRDPDSYSTVFFPFVWAKGDKTRDMESLAILPLYYYSRVGDKKIRLYPVYIYSKSDWLEFEAEIPVHWYWSTPDYNIHIITIPPVFSIPLLPPPFQYKDDDKTVRGLFPFLWLTKGKNYYSYTLLPLLWGGKNEAEQSKSFNIFPLYLSNYSSESELRALLLLNWYYRTPESRLNIYAPPIYRYEADEKVRYGLFPLIWKTAGRQYSSFGLLPFAWGHNDEEAETKSLFLLPFHVLNKTSDSKFKMWFLLYWYNKNPYSEITIIPPWFKEKSDTGSLNVVFPVYWKSKSSEHNNLVVFPFYWKFSDFAEKSDSLTIFPFYHKNSRPGSSLMTAMGYYWDIRNPDSRLRFAILPPLFKQETKEATKEGLFPFYWYTTGIEYRSRVFFPVYWSGADTRNQSSYLTVFPFYFAGRSPGQGHEIVFPLYWNYWNRDFKISVYGLIWKYSADENINKYGFFPLLWLGKGTDYRFTAFLPFFWNYSNLKEKSSVTAIVPLLYYNTRDPEKKFETLFPLYWNIRNPFYHLRIFALYYDKQENERKTTGIFPLLKYNRASDYWSFYFVPFIWADRDAEWRTEKLLILPLLYYHNKKPADEFKVVTPLYWHYREDNYSLTVFPPPFFKETEVTDNGNTARNYGLFPLVWLNLKDYEYSLTIVPLLQHWYKNSKEKYSGSFFLPFWGHHQSENLTFNMAMMCFWDYNDTGENYRFTAFLPALYYRKTDNNSRSWGIFPVIWSREKPKYSSFVIFPFLWNYRNDEEDSRSLSILPFYSHRLSPGEEFSEYMLLYWNWRNRDSELTVVPPYFLQEKPGERKTGFAPFLWLTSRENYYSGVLFPLAWWHRDSENSTSGTNILPVYFAYQSTNTLSRLFFPVHYTRKTPGYRLSITLLYYNWATSEGYSRKGIAPFIWASRKDGYSSSGFLPFYWTSADKTIGKKALTILPLYAYSLKPQREYEFYAPFYFYWKNREKEVTTRYYAGPLVQHKTTGSEKEVFSVLWHLYRNELDKTANKRTVDLMPFFTYEKNGSELTYFALLGRLFSYDKINNENTYLFFIKQKIVK